MRGHAGGAEGRGAIQALIKLANASGSGRRGGAGVDGGGEDAAEAGEEGDQPQQQGGGKARRRRGSEPLRRPLIAICNDLYAPALRPLRAVAKIVHFRPPAVR
jgi:chromosome transmission fidelity protein 18